MRKRSEVRGSSEGASERQRTIDDGKPEDKPASSGKTVDFYVCPRESCGLKQSKQSVVDNGGECVRCAMAIDTDAAPAESVEVRGKPADKPKDEDPWKLRPGSTDKPKEETQAAKLEEYAKKNGVAPKPVESRDPHAPLESKKTHPGQQPMGPDEMPLSELAKHLNDLGFVVTVHDLAEQSPVQRARAAYIAKNRDLGDVPKWLAAKAGARERGRAVEARASTEMRADTQGPMMSVHMPEAADTVSYTWGEEKITPVKDSYSTVTVGPFTATTRVRPGEGPLDALERLVREVGTYAEAERDRKVRSFLEKLMGIRKQTKEQTVS